MLGCANRKPVPWGNRSRFRVLADKGTAPQDDMLRGSLQKVVIGVNLSSFLLNAWDRHTYRYTQDARHEHHQHRVRDEFTNARGQSRCGNVLLLSNTLRHLNERRSRRLNPTRVGCELDTERGGEKEKEATAERKLSGMR